MPSVYVVIPPEQLRALGDWVEVGESMASVQVEFHEDDSIHAVQGDGYLNIDPAGNVDTVS